MGLWRHRDFLKLWAGQTISLFGTQVTAVALALTAAVVLQATPAEMGVIGTDLATAPPKLPPPIVAHGHGPEAGYSQLN